MEHLEEAERYQLSDLGLTEYQELTIETAVYEDVGAMTLRAQNYCAVGLAGEVGEVLNKWKKVLRGDYEDDITIKWEKQIAEELGDCLWYIARLAGELGWTLESVAQMNLMKLQARKEKEAIKGSGDER